MSANGVAPPEARLVEGASRLEAVLFAVREGAALAVATVEAARRVDATGAGATPQPAPASKTIRKEPLELVTSTEATAATLEETARSIKGVGANAEELAAATEELLASTTEAATTNEDMALRGQSNAAAIEEMAATIEEMSKGISRLASDAQAVNERVSGVMSSVVTVGKA